MKRTGFVVLTFEMRREGERWIGRCKELGTATFADTVEQLHRELGELVRLHLSTLEEVGERDRFFKEHRIKFYSDDVPRSVSRRIPVDEPSVDEPILVHSHSFPVGISA